MMPQRVTGHTKSVISFVFFVLQCIWCVVLINIRCAADVNKYSAPMQTDQGTVLRFQDSFIFHSKYVRLNNKDFYYMLLAKK